MLQKLVLNPFFFYFPLLEVSSCSAPRPLQWCIVVCCCKHPRLEAVPAPAFSQMFAAPGYAWTPAEGEAVMNPYVHLYLSSSVSTKRDELHPCELSWLVGVTSWNLIWNGDPKLWWCMHCSELSSLLLCVINYRIRFPWNDQGWWTSAVTHEPFIASSVVCFSSFSYFGLWGQIIITSVQYLAGLISAVPCFLLFSLEFCIPSLLVRRLLLIVSWAFPKTKIKVKNILPSLVLLFSQSTVYGLVCGVASAAPTMVCCSWKLQLLKVFLQKSSLVQFLTTSKTRDIRNSICRKVSAFHFSPLGSARAVAWILPGISFLLCFTLVFYFSRDGQWE